MDTVQLQVTGMSCSGCEQRIAKVLGRVDGVREVSADHSSGHVHVRLGPELADRAVLVERIEAAGFEVTEGASR
ncbi:copper chaperone [Allosaccharopolyspora coralli]|uniref:Heavy-metal-associated domain-containing protein n=3 Tax=Actinomycetota TaxID=201174 RepID=A0A929FYZ4_9PSEU|nr:heavy-metal-associated domain-containing protein [Saccharopolyspora sp. HNM0983]MBE9376341.1 heavy-metal-associated domain-containing protein [Saccharopolyspora sp. HNM0983]NHD15721.1 heavy-metal-associated domain-containing protein [Actinopolyspora sp. BKK2]NHE75065.1 heavy-metal-associated domain-containing protein [Actinopolyspora sp. BKK1]QGK68699.1 copper chaperone [Allosaccharopolyspora coralli]